MTAFALTGTPGTYRVDLDGDDITRHVQAVAVKAGSVDMRNEFPQVVLALAATDLNLDLPDAVVRVDPETAALLVRLGWTPPKELP